MLYLPSLDVVLLSYSPVCEEYLIDVAGAVLDPPHREGGYTPAPDWLDHALHVASSRHKGPPMRY